MFNFYWKYKKYILLLFLIRLLSEKVKVLKNFLRHQFYNFQ